jgi:PPOX class probable F420-dependent enzyme
VTSVRLSRDEAWDVLEHAHTGILTTLRRDGTPISLPVWFVVDDHHIYVSTPPGTKKIARIRNDPRASFVVESGHRWVELLGVHLTARAEVVADDDVDASRIRDAIETKYAAFRTQREEMPDTAKSFYEARGEPVLIRLVPDEKILTWDNARLGLP